MGYPNSIFSFTNKSAGQTIQSATINDLQNEVAAIESGLITGPISLAASTLASLSVAGGSTLAGALNVAGGSTFAQQVICSSAVFIGDSTNTGMSQGLTINQAGFDNEIISFKSSDVAHGVTTVAETDTYGYIKKSEAGSGGLEITALADNEQIGLSLRSVMDLTGTTKGTNAVGSVNVIAQKPNGTGVTDHVANTNLMVIRNNATTRFIFDADGDSHQDVGTAWTNFDSVDDAMTLNALAVYVSRDDDPYKDAIRQKFGQALEVMIPREAMERMKLVTFNKDGHHFVNMSKLAMLHTGAIRQLADRCSALMAEVADLKKRLPAGE